MSTIQLRFEDLPKDQQYILTKLYELYLQCLKNDSSKRVCNNFNSTTDIAELYFNHMHYDDVLDDCLKLRTKGFVKGITGDNKLSFIEITDDTIVYFENKFKNDLNKVKELLKDIASFIPGL